MALDYEVKQRHVILVLGVDGGVSSRTGTATVTINVQDVQDMIPLFTETNIERSIPERQPVSTSVAQVVVCITNFFGYRRIWSNLLTMKKDLY